MTYGMTKEQMIAANRELINAVQAKEERIRELEAAIAVYQDAEPIWRKRVTELEAELLEAANNMQALIFRAEKAESLISCQQPGNGPCSHPDLPCMKHQLARSQARIVELEREAPTPTHRDVNRHDGTGEHLEDVEAREREK